MTDEISICGVLVHARPSQVGEVRARLAAIAGVEIHACTGDGRLVVTIEEVGDEPSIDTLASLYDVAGVLSASLVYQHSE